MTLIRLNNIDFNSRYDAGINTFDTANIYSNGKSEIILGNAIRKLGLPREEIVVMTKVTPTAFGVWNKPPSTNSFALRFIS